jgi:hypothetical protein
MENIMNDNYVEIAADLESEALNIFIKIECLKQKINKLEKQYKEHKDMANLIRKM